MEQFLKPDELQKIAEDAEFQKIKEVLEKKRKADQSKEDLKQAFQSREVSPQAAERINTVVRAAAKRGVREILVVEFPSRFCNDGGRRINNFEPDWPDSLEGFGKKAYEFFEKELRPLGFKLRAEIMNYPEGTLGDVGLYLKW